MHLRSMRLPRRARGVLGLLLLPGLLLRCAREDHDDLAQVEAEGSSFDFVDDAQLDLQPIALVQLTWNLTKGSSAEESLPPAPGHDLPVARSSPEAARSISRGKDEAWGAAFVETLSKQRGLQGVGRERADAVGVVLIVCSAAVLVALVAVIFFANMEGHEAEGEQEGGKPKQGRRGSPGSSRSAAAAGSLLQDPSEALQRGSTVPMYSSEESQADGQPEKDEVDLSEDIYSLALVGFIRNGVALLTGRSAYGASMAVHGFRLLAVLVLLGANYLLQFGILYFIATFVVSPSIATVQGIYREFRKTCFFPSGEFYPGGCAGFQEIDELCGLVFTYTWFMLLILMLWTMTMVRELRDIERLARIIIWNIESTTHVEKVLEYHGGKEHVTHLTPMLRFLIFLVVTLPKICITTILGVLGTLWLSSTSNLTEVIVRAVELEFIVKIDEMLFDAVVPKMTKLDLAKFKLTLREKHVPGVMNAEVFRAYMMSVLYLVVIVAAPPLYLTVGQQVPSINVFPGYKRGEVEQVCIPYLDAHRQRTCVLGSQVCFPYGR